MSETRYLHTNIVARDWKRIAAFYVEVFGCTVLPPERDLSGRWLDELTGIPNAHIRGAHLALPGCGDGGPTLEIFSYAPEAPGPVEEAAMNQPGYGHIAFLVDDVESIVRRVENNGGGIVGSVVRHRYETLGTLTVAYCRDPERNHIEVQNWSM